MWRMTFSASTTSAREAFAALSGCACQRKAGKKAPIFSPERALKSARGVHAWKAVQCND